MSGKMMDTIVSLCKRRGFIFQSSEIYGGLGSVWDYGPLGVELKRNVKEAWWRSVVYRRSDMVGLDAAILMHPKTWDASGHLEGFTDLMVDCKSCKKRFKVENTREAASMTKCPECNGALTEARPFNLMFETYHGPVKESAAIVYLRPETAQGMFVNFRNILDVSRKKLPFGIAQIGKAFRNEITPGNFTFRTREFEQMEIEYFVKPDEAPRIHQEWIEERFNWYVGLGISPEALRKKEHAKVELAHYAAACSDIEYNFPFGWSELEGIANRTDFDLKRHAEFSGKDMTYFDATTNERYYPYIIEPSGGVDRATLAFLVDAYHEEVVRERKRVVLRLHKDLAPIKVAVLPLLKNRPEIVARAQEITQAFKKQQIASMYDDTAAIGKLYRRQDEVGTLFCLTVDVESLEDKKVTVRDRDTMTQERIAIDTIVQYITDKLND